MKRFIITLLTLWLTLDAVAQENPTPEHVYEIYQYCIEDKDPSSYDADTEVLQCINDELEYNEYQTFDSLAAVLDFIAAYLD